MRLGIRRKLIGTLMLVGIFPLAVSLIVILGGGAAMQLSRIRNAYEQTAENCSARAADELRDELKSLLFVSRLPRVEAYLREHGSSAAPLPSAPATAPTLTPAQAAMESRWPKLTANDPELKTILNNELADRLRLLTELDARPREIVVTNSAGEVIAADHKPARFVLSDQDWWKAAWDSGRGRVFVSTVQTTSTPTGVINDVIIALPVYDLINGKPVITGIIKDRMPADSVLDSLKDDTTGLAAQAQLIDLDAKKTLYSPTTSATVDQAEKFYFSHANESNNGEPHVRIATMLFNDLVIGARRVPFDEKLVASLKGLQSPGVMDTPLLPKWVVVVSKPSGEAMTPVYRLAITVAAIGIALILVLFILGVAISNREIIMPILRLREATAAVGRGELNVRLLSESEEDAAFRKDELGDLARDFDEMTRQLQKNVTALARSNEAKRRFMELAGHELRTPVTYLIGVCQLAQRQIQQLASAATDGAPEDAASIATAAKNAAAVQSALGKITAKTQRLSRIIENLLKLVNNDQFTTRMNKTSVDIRALLLQVTSDHRPFINERKQTLIVDIAENLPSIEADRDKLEDALTNLISNAIRFSPDGGTVRVAAREVPPPNGDMLEILVEDSGPGIPQQDLANLFEPFYTGSDILHHHSGTFEFGSKGIGLGLAIVRRFIELHGGIVRAHTLIKEDKTTGTQFQILLPLNRENDLGGVPPADAGPAPERA